MKRNLIILVSVGAALALCFLSYLKGHADGVHRSRMIHLGFDVTTLKKMEEGELEWAKSDQALFLWSALNAEEKRSSWLNEWIEWRGTDSDERFERHRADAQAFVAKYQNTFTTAEHVEAALEEELGVPVETIID